MSQTKRTRLELTWIGKDSRPRLEPRILVEERERSYHAPHRVTEHDLYDNSLIFGDNLLALKALEADYAGKVKCIYIDPPYNTGSAFTQYDDGLEHSIWLSMMRDRLEILRRLLSEDGSIWVSIDDNECHYLKILMDEIFGRQNFIANIVWQKRYAPDVRLSISDAHENLLCYVANPTRFAEKRNLLDLNEEQIRQFKNPDNDERGPWKASDFTAAGFRPNQMYEITLPSGRVVTPPKGRCWRVTYERFEEFQAKRLMYYGPSGDSLPSLKRFLSELQGMVPWTWWSHIEAGHSQEGKKESQILFGRDGAFATPKPERLLRRIIHIASNPGDLVLDSFAGSGTTGAVAHKMGRRWIMIELGEHCHTHIIPRMKKVIDGTDQGGISKDVGWKGGGGFRYYRLAPSLLEQDKWGNWVINKKYNAAMLAEALCKLEGFKYAPSEINFWQHGQSTERDYIYVTTQTLTQAQLAYLNDQVGPNRSLLVLCAAFRGKVDQYESLTVKKIPNHILSNCEWGRDDYSLEINNLPMAPRAPEQMSLFDGTARYEAPRAVEISPSNKKVKTPRRKAAGRK